MDRKHDRKPEPGQRSIDDLSTPLWDRYYKAIRRRVRFPRYYKKGLNW